MFGLLKLSNSFEAWQKRGHAIRLLIWGWVFLFLFTVIFSLLGIHSYYQFWLVRPTARPIWIYLGRDGLITVCYLLFAVWFVVNRSGRGMPLLAAYTLVAFALAKGGFADAFIVHDPSSPVFLKQIFFVLVAISNWIMVLFIVLFPNGRFVPSWSRYFIGFWVLFLLLCLMVPSFPLNFLYFKITDSSAAATSFMFTCYALAIAFQVYRYVYVSNDLERRQTKWVIFGILMGLVAGFFDYGLRYLNRVGFFSVNALGDSQPYWLQRYLRNIAMSLGYCVFPFSLRYALSRNQLWPVDPLVRRILQYGSLTTVVVLIYSALVALLSLVFSQRFNFLSSLLATGIVAVLFQPLRQRLQNRINHLLYGQRDDPYKVLSNLSQQMTGSLDTRASLQELCESTSQVLKLPFVGVFLHEMGDNLVASFGEVNQGLIKFDLTHKAEIIGVFQVAQRAQGELFSKSELLLLKTIAQQISVSAHNYLLSQALQLSHERLIISREEERKRIRRDLHDGLGPTLASTALQLETARELIYSRPDEGASILKSLELKMTNTLAEIKDLVYDLYPSAIDQFGLYQALAIGIRSFETVHLKTEYSVQGELEYLPAAIEVACYRIILEAVNNVAKHASAKTVIVQLTRKVSQLDITVSDDGIGLKLLEARGLGLNSIHERAEELGGKATFESLPLGTRCTIMLPIRSLT